MILFFSSKALTSSVEPSARLAEESSETVIESGRVIMDTINTIFVPTNKFYDKRFKIKSLGGYPWLVVDGI
jgi:hypothetical protein